MHYPKVFIFCLDPLLFPVAYEHITSPLLVPQCLTRTSCMSLIMAPHSLRTVITFKRVDEARRKRRMISGEAATTLRKSVLRLFSMLFS